MNHNISLTASFGCAAFEKHKSRLKSANRSVKLSMNNDQWFEPGDKVMRVALAEDFGLPSRIFRNPTRIDPKTNFGLILCVESCIRYGSVNVVSFIGVEGMFYAKCFRRVEEIRLYLNAVKKTKEPQLV